MTHPAESFLQSLPINPVVDRRGFLTFAAKGLVVGCLLPLAGRIGNVSAATPTNQDLASAYIHIGSDNSITLMFGGAEMGQGSLSGLAQILAEELMVDWNQIAVAQSLVNPIVSYLTGGSSAVRGRYNTLRSAGIAAREMLIGAAMLVTGDTTRANYAAQSATVKYVPKGTTWTYGQLAGTAATVAPPDPLPPYTDPAKFRVIGQRVPRVDIPQKTDGSAVYGIDVRLPNMVFAAIKHCPVFGGTLPAGAKLGMPSGALAVVPVTASDNRGAVVAGTINAVAVVASNTWQANRLARSLSIPWVMPASTANVDSTQILAQAKSLAAAAGGALIAEPAPPTGTTPATYAPIIEAQVKAALGTPTLDATYTLPYLAHATMEVLNCTCSITTVNGVKTCEIWAPTQSSASVASLAATLTQLPASAITVHTTFLGGGLGRKFELDFASQAIQVAMAVGKPVKLTWFREEDFAHDQYRPLAVVNAKATLDANGRIKAWWYRSVSQAILGQRGWLPPGAVDSQAVEGAIGLPYALGTHVSEWVPLPNSVAAIPVGFWRSVGSSINAFAVESMVDELSMLAKVDPFTFRFNHMDPNADPRAYKVLQMADTNSQWRKSLASGHTWGMAYAESFGTRVCEVVEISSPTASSVKVHRVLCVIDCGIAINPDSVEAQMQGGILHALNATLWGQSTFTAGKANQTNFSKYRVMRPNEMPAVQVVIVASTNPPSGTGEPGVPPLGPALANAYARLTGLRKRDLPLFPGATMDD